MEKAKITVYCTFKLSQQSPANFLLKINRVVKKLTEFIDYKENIRMRKGEILKCTNSATK